MKLRNKLLTALLPITAASALAPALSSCNKGDGFTISYGDEINCLDETAKNYHSLDRVKTEIKKRANLDQGKEVSLGDLHGWESQSTEMQKQAAFFDFIASLAVMEQIKFHLVFDAKAESDIFVLTYLKDGQEVTAKGKIVSYCIHTAADLNVGIQLQSLSGDWVKCHSYTYQNCKIAQ